MKICNISLIFTDRYKAAGQIGATFPALGYYIQSARNYSVNTLGQWFPTSGSRRDCWRVGAGSASSYAK